MLRWIIVGIFRRSKGRSRGSGGGGTCSGTWAPTPNTSTRLSAAAATTSAPRSPCWRGAAPKPAGLRPPATTTSPAYESCRRRRRRARAWNVVLQNIRTANRTREAKSKNTLPSSTYALLAGDTTRLSGSTFEAPLLFNDSAHARR